MISRREVLGIGAAAAAGLGVGEASACEADVGRDASGATESPSPGPVLVASGNGLRGVGKGREMILAGADPLDAAVAGVEIQELDPEDQSVGLGGLPNEEGVVQLDASCMHGPTRRAGAVAALERVPTAARLAQAVMEHTDHIMLAGEGALRFARALGFEERELLTEESRLAWLQWKSRRRGANWLFEGPDQETTGTINLCALDTAGDLASVTTTSGLSWKLPGRVGDSPIIGAGQYCDNTVGAAGSTGRGEANIKVCGAFLAVELMRLGRSPEQACLEVLQRVLAMTEDRLLDDRGRPRFQLTYYALAKDGRFGAASIYGRSDETADPWDKFAVADAQGARLLPKAFLFPKEQRPKN